jgi:hypothetical protein
MHFRSHEGVNVSDFCNYQTCFIKKLTHYSISSVQIYAMFIFLCEHLRLLSSEQLVLNNTIDDNVWDCRGSLRML